MSPPETDNKAEEFAQICAEGNIIFDYAMQGDDGEEKVLSPVCGDVATILENNAEALELAISGCRLGVRSFHNLVYAEVTDAMGEPAHIDSIPPEIRSKNFASCGFTFPPTDDPETPYADSIYNVCAPEMELPESIHALNVIPKYGFRSDTAIMSNVYRRFPADNIEQQLEGCTPYPAPYTPTIASNQETDGQTVTANLSEKKVER